MEVLEKMEYIAKLRFNNHIVAEHRIQENQTQVKMAVLDYNSKKNIVAAKFNPEKSKPQKLKYHYLVFEFSGIEYVGNMTTLVFFDFAGVL